LKDLRSAIYYYEHVADAHGDAQRKSSLEATATKLRKILVQIEKELQGKSIVSTSKTSDVFSAAMDDQIAKLNQELIGLFDVPELQKLKVFCFSIYGMIAPYLCLSSMTYVSFCSMMVCLVGSILIHMSRVKECGGRLSTGRSLR
jgi:hypothetical protein